MIRLTVANQKGGVAKTTTVTTLGRYFADQGKRVLIIDTDPQGCVSSTLGVKGIGAKNLNSFLAKNIAFEDCIVSVHPKIDILPSNRETIRTEQVLNSAPARELIFLNTFPQVDKDYDVVLIDVPPSLNLLQICSFMYTQKLLIPTTLDAQSMMGMGASIETSRMIGDLLHINVQVVAVLPVIVDQRLQITRHSTVDLQKFAVKNEIPILPGIRTDTSVTRASREQQFLIDYDPKCRAIEDYIKAFEALEPLLVGSVDDATQNV
jgi:chromosome partitioning protein